MVNLLPKPPFMFLIIQLVVGARAAPLNLLVFYSGSSKIALCLSKSIFDSG